MLELPEASTIAAQLRSAVLGRTITEVVVNASPHKFAFFTGAPEAYPGLLTGGRIVDARAMGGLIELTTGELSLVIGDGVGPRLVEAGGALPAKHQLALGLDDGSALVCSLQMYGGMYLGPAGDHDNPYYRVARDRPSPLTDAFDQDYFDDLLAEARPNLATKGFLATEQRVPGLGNGVLQDILFRARLHPRNRLSTLTGADRRGLLASLKETLTAMVAGGGRDTEKDLHGRPGGYPTVLSARTLDLPCPDCGGAITRQAFLGGNVYVCEHCQPLRG